LIIDGYLSLILRTAQHGFKPCHLVGEGVHIKLHMQAQIQQIKSKLIHHSQLPYKPFVFCKKFCIVAKKLNLFVTNSMTKSLNCLKWKELEGVFMWRILAIF